MIKNTVVIFIILQLDALCQLQCQRIAGQAGLFQDIQNRGGDVFFKQLNIRKIDADVQAGKRAPPFPADKVSFTLKKGELSPGSSPFSSYILFIIEIFFRTNSIANKPCN